MAPKDDKAPEAAKTETKDDKAPEKAATQKVDPAEKELAERIFIQMCVNHRQGFNDSHCVKKAHDFAKAFLAFEPPAE